MSVRRRLKIAVAAIAACVVSQAAAHAQISAEQFLNGIRSAIRGGDRAGVADQVRYPITVRIGGVRVPFPDASALLARYDEIFTPGLASEIGQHVVAQQINGRWRITAIDVPDSDSSASEPAAGASRGARSSEPARVGIRGGPRPTRVPGTLLPGGTDVYVLWVPKGRVLEARLERVQGRAALLRVVHAGTGAPLNPRIPIEARVVTGVALESADYRIEVRRGEGGDPAPLPYMMALTLR